MDSNEANRTRHNLRHRYGVILIVQYPHSEFFFSRGVAKTANGSVVAPFIRDGAFSQVEFVGKVSRSGIFRVDRKVPNLTYSISVVIHSSVALTYSIIVAVIGFVAPCVNVCNNALCFIEKIAS